MSVSQMLQPIWPCAGVALGAAASHWLSAPLSSASTWLQVVQRSLSSGITRFTASEISGNSARWP